MSSQADLAGDFTVGVESQANLAGVITASVASSPDPASVVITGMTFREEFEDSGVFPTDCVCDYYEIAEVALSANLSGNVNVSVTSSADPASVITVGVALRENCGMCSRVTLFVIMMTISMMDIMTNILIILITMIRLTMMVTLVCMAFLGGPWCGTGKAVKTPRDTVVDYECLRGGHYSRGVGGSADVSGPPSVGVGIVL